MALITFLFRQSWPLLLLAIFAGAVSGGASAGLIALINQAIGTPAAIPQLGLVFFGLCLLMFVSKLGAEISLLQLTQTAIYGLRIHLSQKLLATPLKKLQALGKHRLLVILTNDINTFTQAFEWVPKLFINCVLVLGCVGYLAWMSWSLLLLLAGFLAVGMTVFHLAERYALHHLEQVREHKDSLYRHCRSLVEGTKELQLSRGRRRVFIEQAIGPSALAFKQSFVRGMRIYATVANFGMLQFYLAIGLLLFLASRWLPQPDGVLVSFTVTLLFMVQPIVEIMIALPDLREAGIALAKIRQLDGELDAERALPNAATNPFPDDPLHLSLHGVQHRYPGDGDHEFTLGPIDLTLRQGELVFIVGGNGSGKTTLAMLLLGLYEPEAGEIRLNGQVVTAANREAYRQHFAAVFADFHLFEHLLGADRATLAQQADHYLKALRMRHKVRVVDGCYSTTELSAGQRKRLALVAAYLEDRPIYLFDEWAADQDPAFKRVFYAQLLPELRARGKTVVVISHDDAYFDCADRVIKLADGQLQTFQAPVGGALSVAG